MRPGAPSWPLSKQTLSPATTRRFKMGRPVPLLMVQSAGTPEAFEAAPALGRGMKVTGHSSSERAHTAPFSSYVPFPHLTPDLNASSCAYVCIRVWCASASDCGGIRPALLPEELGPLEHVEATPLVAVLDPLPVPQGHRFQTLVCSALGLGGIGRTHASRGVLFSKNTPISTANSGFTVQMY